ncbi:unnamed protein product [Adineta ricciae]|uniref:Uncharacterized protein n=1 Tax=Adineta ricciae TaxID=249248 RepID=A0A814CS61_ADIRI|nr:unnamed protein product [Adineta ricciae]CAF1118644.1 unnamed protein product [Adineta ricciae]
MSTKHELQLMMKTYGYDLNTFTSKETLMNLLHLHSKALDKGIDVPKMNDHELRRSLNEHNIVAGPVIGKQFLLNQTYTNILKIGHTRAIYQRKLLEAITNENSEGADDDTEDADDDFHTPPIPEDGIVTRSGKTLFPSAQ